MEKNGISILVSVKPKWCRKIADGEKTIELRKTKPNMDIPFKCYIYCTKRKDIIYSHSPSQYDGNGKVIGEFICDKIIRVDCDSVAPFDHETKEYIDKESCVDRSTLWKYTNGRQCYGWHISDLKIYKEPKNLSDFYKPGSDTEIKKAPQSWLYAKHQ